MSLRLVVLDRDGVINHDSDAFIKSAEEWHTIDGSAEAIGRLTLAGFTVVVATNQSGLGRGLFDKAALTEIHQKMRDRVGVYGGVIQSILFCPHVPEDNCECRKPKAGLLLQVAAEFGIGLADTPVIGDSMRDIDAATSVGARPLLVLTGNGSETAAALNASGRDVEVFASLAEAVNTLIAENRAVR